MPRNKCVNRRKPGSIVSSSFEFSTTIPPSLSPLRRPARSSKSLSSLLPLDNTTTPKLSLSVIALPPPFQVDSILDIRTRRSLYASNAGLYVIHWNYSCTSRGDPVNACESSRSPQGSLSYYVNGISEHWLVASPLLNTTVTAKGSFGYWFVPVESA
ncbi:hypothetical protein EYR41_002499 [Orbilia oligospora]|uniref:Uncharacterized protein n=1 Tax=Orbilia oligospora TaxID=2813651 RepID=A0A8H2DIT4_ORBOL|nr:hypothetical protein TWF128_001822 [Orbilia oligospora]KAF3282907.1 hypothetical protein TWF132_010544 [Orbilia oligospora]TGJ62525.1 hypothetical protein EYR41_002499 [Orbilia oligospora]